MSQFGMQIPGARARRGASADVYTGLAAVATIFLIVACFVMFKSASTVGKNGNPLSLQEPSNIVIQGAQATPGK
jgi:hypothetical protein